MNKTKTTLLMLMACCMATAVNAQQAVPYFPAADSNRQGFLRIVNDSAHQGTVTITAIDDNGLRSPAVTLTLQALQAVHINSDDLEDGNADKGLSAGIGRSHGDWRLQVTSDLDVEVAAYVRAADGLVTSVHDLVPIVDGEHRVLTFNPGHNTRQVSRLRIINPGEFQASVRIQGVDGTGRQPGETIGLRVPPRASRSYTAQQLERGSNEFNGALGSGQGKWQLFVGSDHPIEVMSLLENPTGHITNLSTLSGISARQDGPAMKAAPGTDVYLRSVAALDCANGASSYQWGQISGAIAALSDEHAEMPQITIPDDADSPLVFRLNANCDGQRITDTVTIQAVAPRRERVLSALVDFEDVNIGDRPLSRQDLAARLTDDSRSLAAYLTAASRGLLSAEFTVLDWITVRKRTTDYPLGGGSVVADVVNRLALSANLDEYDKVFPAIYPLEQGHPGCAAHLTPVRFNTVDGPYQLGAAWLSGYDMGCVRHGRIAHEFGHTFGFVHSLQLQCDSTVYGLPASTIDPDQWDSCHILNACADENCSDVGAGESGFGLNSDPDMMGGDATVGYLDHFPMVYQAAWQAHAGWLDDNQIITEPGSHWITSLESISTTPKALRIRIGRDQAGGAQDYWLETRQRVPVFDPTDNIREEPCVVAVRLATPNLYGQRGYDNSGHTDTLRFSHSRQSPFGTQGWLSARPDEPVWDPHRGVRFRVVQCVQRPQEGAVNVAVERSWLSIDPPVVAVLSAGQARISVTNGGPRTVNVGVPAIKGRHSERFTVEQDGCANLALGPGVSCRIDVTASTTIESVAFLLVPNDDDLAPKLTVSLMVNPESNGIRRVLAPLRTHAHDH